MKTTKKALLFTFCAVMLVVASVLGTMAYLTSSDTVTNTFTVGKVNITLDEAKVNLDGTYVTNKDDRTEDGNKYHLLPGHEYHKDPTVTVEAGSEESYVRMIVKINKQAALDEIFKSQGGASLNEIFLGYNPADWVLVKETVSGDVRSYEFRYKNTVAASNEKDNVKLEALFEKIKVPGKITKEQLATIADLKIDVEAHAIQADGFQSKDGKTAEQVAWEAFDQQVNNSQGATENH